MQLDMVLEKVRNSAFNKNSTDTSVNLKRFIKSLELYTHYDAQINNVLDTNTTSKEFLDHCVPDFQRTNDKWSKEMQVKFVENILSGAHTTLMVYMLNPQGDAMLLDGLQRTTAILKFLDGNIEPFGLNIKDIPNLKKFNTHITLKIYTFDNIEEVGKFYIDMNENITHSPEDIKKCKDYFLSYYGITL